MTSLAEERAEQARWKLRPQFAGVDLFDRLVENEFTSPQDVSIEEARALRAIVEFAVATVPYYRALFSRLGLSARDIRDRRDLPRLPVLGRRQLTEGFESLKPDALPPEVEVVGMTKTSGSTGPPARVLTTRHNNLMFTYLNQRQTRWFRRDPWGTAALLRLPRSMPQPRPGEYLAAGESLRVPGWRYLGVFFETGPAVAFSISNPVEDQLAWLRRERPDYLLTHSYTLEHLVMAAGGETPCGSLKAMTAISEAISPATCRYLQQMYGAPVQQAYGLNEIGLVAVRCEAERYHVHREHCLAEIIGADGTPTPPGQAGRLILTALQNPAMPLVRYDTNDLVVALEGPCPCGRSLPSFGEVLGRCSHVLPLPPGTVERVEALIAALRAAPMALRGTMRRYQVHQLRGGDFELRVATAGGMPPLFGVHIRSTWSQLVGAAGPRLTMREVADIPTNPATDKFDLFVSDYYEKLR